MYSCVYVHQPTTGSGCVPPDLPQSNIHHALTQSCKAKPESRKLFSVTLDGHGQLFVPHSNCDDRLSHGYNNQFPQGTFHKTTNIRYTLHSVYHIEIQQWAGGTSRVFLETGNWWHLWKLWSISKSPDRPRLLQGCHRVRAQDEPDPNVCGSLTLPNYELILTPQDQIALEKKDLGWKTVRKLASLLEKSPNCSSLIWGDE